MVHLEKVSLLSSTCSNVVFCDLGLILHENLQAEFLLLRVSVVSTCEQNTFCIKYNNDWMFFEVLTNLDKNCYRSCKIVVKERRVGLDSYRG